MLPTPHGASLRKLLIESAGPDYALSGPIRNAGPAGEARCFRFNPRRAFYSRHLCCPGIPAANVRAGPAAKCRRPWGFAAAHQRVSRRALLPLWYSHRLTAQAVPSTAAGCANFQPPRSVTRQSRDPRGVRSIGPIVAY